jgi:hypothetical protein
MSTVIGIDPGANTGIAIFQDGVLYTLLTIEPWELPAELATWGGDRVVFEDSRLQTNVFGRDVPGKPKMNPAAKLKIARDVGRIDAWCSLITAVCGELGIPAHGISPKGKGAKLDAEQFAERTGWVGRCNQHERDAALVAWPYRKAAL